MTIDAGASHDKDLSKRIDWLQAGAGIAFSAALLVTWIGVYQIAGTRGAWLAVGWALAFFFPAFVVGMLFGVPRSRPDGGASPVAQNQRGAAGKLQLNASLEQISDWATKMITGVTLVSARSIPSYCFRAGQYIGYALTERDSPASASTGSLIAVMFSGIGFISGYLFASTYLTGLLNFTMKSLLEDTTASIPEGVKEELKQSTDRAGSTTPLGEGSANQLSPAGARAVQELKDLSFDPNASTESLELLGMAKLNAGNFPDAKQIFESVISRDPTRFRSRQALATSLLRLGNLRQAVRTLEDALPLPPGQSQGHLIHFYEILSDYSLHLEPPENFEKAKYYADQFLSNHADPYGSIMLNKACALGEEAAYHKKQDPAVDISDPARQACDIIAAILENVSRVARGHLQVGKPEFKGTVAGGISGYGLF